MTQEENTVVRPNGIPLRVGVGAAVIAILLSVFGMIKNSGIASLNPVSLLLVVLIAGGSWGVVSWAITTAVFDVEADVAEEDGLALETSAPAAQEATPVVHDTTTESPETK
jgi:hypothetical protein